MLVFVLCFHFGVFFVILRENEIFCYMNFFLVLINITIKKILIQNAAKVFKFADCHAIYDEPYNIIVLP